MDKENLIFKIGQGFDIHKLCIGRPLIIGGVSIPFKVGLFGHSDADVLIHAIIDSILGALCLGDIGVKYPNTDLQYHCISSRVLLREIRQDLEKMQWGIVNIDATVHIEKPKIQSYIKEMIRNLSNDLDTESNCINIKAKTNEGLGFIGRGKGVAASVVTMLKKRSPQ